ncbi:TRAP-type mannitol/chloroaromatic compound transport system permease small subunit [Aliiruegeria haliotis]|uniref:TRAP transporter small permease protein n=1 Tax=Aliiruegeria haliotis TaxID=1280846 RepID=A0A2T0RVA4_9RHOB|nr:TRAP transporter small permease subunit [Aliiruegeria haliotis]PRY25125.1 TRAP-type mannitol/chloroaromatic compound transport system permease small subunit [Aliiruegeria haliotis]
MTILSKTASRVHHLTRRLCQILLGLMFIGQFSVVILRYVFGVGFIELQDAVAYSFATLVVLGLPVAQALDAHVRVDVFRSGQTTQVRHWFDRVGIAAFLIPVFGLTIWWGWPDVTYSWSIREASVETGGLPGLYLVKTMLPLACVLMILQGISGLFVPASETRDA